MGILRIKQYAKSYNELLFHFLYIWRSTWCCIVSTGIPLFQWAVGGGTSVTENKQGWKLWIKYVQQVNAPNTVYFTIYWAYGKQAAWSIPTECHVCTNFHCYSFSLTLTLFSPFHGHKTNTVPHRTWCNCLQFGFELSANITVITDQQTKTGNVRIP